MIPNEFLETAHAYRVLSELQPKQLIKVLPSPGRESSHAIRSSFGKGSDPLTCI